MLREKQSISLGQVDQEVLDEVPNKQTAIQLPPSKVGEGRKYYFKITGFSEAAAIYANCRSNLKYPAALWYFIL